MMDTVQRLLAMGDIYELVSQGITNEKEEHKDWAVNLAQLEESEQSIGTRLKEVTPKMTVTILSNALIELRQLYHKAVRKGERVDTLDKMMGEIYSLQRETDLLTAAAL